MVGGLCVTNRYLQWNFNTFTAKLSEKHVTANFSICGRR